MKIWVVLFSALGIFACSSIASAKQPDFLLESEQNNGNRIAIYAFPTFSIVEQWEGLSNGRNSRYSVQMAPALPDATRRSLACFNEPNAGSSSIQCDSGALPPSEPEFDTCDNCWDSPVCPQSCVQIWDFETFMVVASYGAIGDITVTIEEKEDDDDDDSGKEDGK